MKKILSTIAAAAILAAPAYADTVSATLDLGGFATSTDQIAGSNIEQAPFNFYYEYSGSQVIYPADQIADLFTKGAKIQSITFRFGDPDYTSYYDMTWDLTCYLQLIDQNQFTVVDNETNWFKPVNTSATATTSVTYDMSMMDSFDVVLTFAEPFEITTADSGKSLLVTSSSACTDGDPTNGQYLRPFTYNNSDRTYRMACYGQDNTTDFTNQVNNGGLISYGDGTHSDVYKTDLPVALISYTYDDNGTGISSVHGDNDNAKEVYDLQGRRVNASDLTPGVYVVRQGAKAQKVVIK